MGSVQGSQCQQGDGLGPSPASSSLESALVSWGQTAKAGVWGIPGGQDVINVMFSGTENQSRRQQRCPVYTV